MSKAYFINTTFNDFLKFSWPVLLEADTLRLWYSLDSVVDNFNVQPVAESNCRPYSSFEVIAVLDDYEPTEIDASHHTFVDYHTLTYLHVQSCDVMDRNLRSIVEQFTTEHLPKVVSQHLSTLRLITIFDVADFAEMLHCLELVHKYWLFRYKIICMKKNQEEEGDEIKDKVEDVNDCILYSNSLINNLELQFKELKNYPEHARLQTLNAFIHLTTGTVGLLEHLLDWH